MIKAVLDFIIIVVMTSSLGKGSAFSAIPVFAFEGTITLIAKLISPIMTELAISYLSLIGSILGIQYLDQLYRRYNNVTN